MRVGLTDREVDEAEHGGLSGGGTRASTLQACITAFGVGRVEDKRIDDYFTLEISMEVIAMILSEEAITMVPKLVGHLASQSACGECFWCGEVSLNQSPFLGGHLVLRIELRAVILL